MGVGDDISVLGDDYSAACAVKSLAGAGLYINLDVYYRILDL